MQIKELRLLTETEKAKKNCEVSDTWETNGSNEKSDQTWIGSMHEVDARKEQRLT